MTYSKEFEVPNKEFPSSSYNLYFRLAYPYINENLAVTTKYPKDNDDYVFIFMVENYRIW